MLTLNPSFKISNIQGTLITSTYCMYLKTQLNKFRLGYERSEKVIN